MTFWCKHDRYGRDPLIINPNKVTVIEKEVRIPIYVNPKTVEDLVAETREAYENLSRLELECKAKNIQVKYLTKEARYIGGRYGSCALDKDFLSSYPVSECNLTLVSTFTKTF